MIYLVNLIKNYTIRKDTKMDRFIECPYCGTPKFVTMSVEPGIKYKNVIYEDCVDVKCRKKFMVPLNYKTIYLARTFAVSEPKYKYPNHVKSYFSGVLDFIDVLDFGDNRDRFFNHPETIVPFDLNLIDKCDILVAYINQPSFGTLGELHYAKHKGMPVYVINHNRIHINDPWLKYIVDELYTDVDRCYNDLMNISVVEYNIKFNEEM